MSHRPVKSALRVLEVLRLFSEQKRALTQLEILRHLDIPQSSTNFLLRTMIEAGYVTYDPKTRLYFPTPEVLHLGKWLEGFGYDFFYEESIITDLLEDIGVRTGETVSIASRNDIFVHFHRTKRRNLPVEMHVEEGSVLPLTYSSYGRMLLSRQPFKQIDRVCRLIRARENNLSRRFDVEVEIASVTAIQDHHFHYSRNPLLPSAGSVAIILPVTIAGRAVAVGVGGPAQRIEESLPAIVEILDTMIARYCDALTATFGSGQGRSSTASATRREDGGNIGSHMRL
ncbi:helix-turn-helix domain-containing protein [Chelativorans sp. ZYF759]|uniref:IclR family transcriptional regulator n=1 Tax=Chelativorans sp. ZYF759 TaxID=2692213 RepID=UPI00145D19A0|nr:helix-turn-helix domain-containing protein [Chelativorans sp. ZYF759]NMG41697.1 helix-turn-helix domain-containing protein [Chelativorans sp. ZYF759]